MVLSDLLKASLTLQVIVNDITFVLLCVVMPILVVLIVMRARVRIDSNRKDVLLSALENNNDVDIKELMGFLNPKKSGTLKEKLLSKLFWGCALTIIALILAALFPIFGQKDLGFILCLTAIPFLAVGIAFIVNYFIGKKMLSDEIEAEKRQKLG